jgi:glycosyltransferase involved in cell wall biosynthesis
MDKIHFTLFLYFLMCRSFLLRKRNEIFNRTKRSKELKRILFLENQPTFQSGAYYRVEILRKYFHQNGIQMEVHCPFSEDEFREKPSLNKFRKHLKKKFDAIQTTRNYDVIVVRRELIHQIQYGNLFLEKLLLSYNKNVILDMDDYMPDLRKHLIDGKRSLFNRFNFFNPLKNTDSFKIFKNYTLAIEEFQNALLIDNPKIEKDRIHIFPMCLDYVTKIKRYEKENKVVGWISHSNHFKRINYITPYLNSIYDLYKFEIHIVADKPYENHELKVPVINKTWSLQNEQEYMLEFDIGIAPIDSSADVKSRKGTFKLVQYMALGIVSVSSYLTYCDRLIKDKISGFLIYEDKEWSTKLLEALQLTPIQMNKIGEISYKNFYQQHHIDSQATSLIEFYTRICERNK